LEQAHEVGGENISDDPEDIPTLASMLFGDDWENEMAA
jgi:hypothetical protein